MRATTLVIISQLALQTTAFSVSSLAGTPRRSTSVFDSETEPESNKLDMEPDDKLNTEELDAKLSIEFDIEDELLKKPVIGLDEDFVPFPSSEYESTEIVEMCMDRLMHNDAPYDGAGYETCWNFSSDICRASQGGSLQQFIDCAAGPVFGTMVNAKSWSFVSKGPINPGTKTRGPMQTCLVHVVPAKGKEFDFIWMLQRERRPPRQDCWLVHQCMGKEAAYENRI